MSRAQRIADFIRRQYVTEQGDVRENVEALFAEDLTYHAGDQLLTREELVAMGVEVRASPRDGRRVEPSGFEETGATVRFHLSATLPGMGESGGDVHQESEAHAWFGADGLVHEVWVRDSTAR